MAVKELFYGDPHHGQTVHSAIDRSTNVPSRILDVERAVEQVWAVADKHGCERIWCLGDLFHVNNPPSTWVARTIRLYRSLLHSFPKIQWCLFDGNHDFNAKPGRENATAGLVEALKHEPNFRFFPTYGCMHDGDRVYHVVPHGARLPDGAASDTSVKHILLCHTTFEGAVNGVEETLLADASRSVGNVEGFHWIFSGHIHKGQDLTYMGQPVHYPGSPERIDFAERAEGKSATVVEWKSDHLRMGRALINTRPMVQHAIVVDDKWTVEAEPWPDVSGALVKIVVSVQEKHLGRFDHKAVRDLLYGAGAHYVAGCSMQIDRERKVRDAQMTESLSTAEALRRYARANLPTKTREDRQFVEDVIARGEEILLEATP